MLAPEGPIHPTPTARSLADVILHPPLGPLAAWAPAPMARRARALLGALPTGLIEWTLWPAIALLPPGVREEFEIPWGRPRRIAAGWLSSGIRRWRPVMPASFRQMPRALAADRRVAAAGRGHTPAHA
jgi:uncharacterized protein (DUF2236 family)